MTAPTLTGADRRALRATGQTLEATLTVGREGITPTVIAALNTQLGRNGLIKVRINAADRHVRHEMFEALASATESALAGAVGHTALYYRPADDEASAPASSPSLAPKFDESADEE